MRLDDRIAALRSDDRLAQLAARLGMREPQVLAVVRIAPTRVARESVRASRCSRRSPDSSFRRWRASSNGGAIAGMHQRTFARVAPMRARLFFYACMAIALFLAWRLCDVQAVKGAIYARRGARAALRYGRSLRAPRQHPGPQWQRPRAFDAVGERLRRTARDRRSRRNRRETRKNLRQARSRDRRGAARPASVVRLDRAQSIARSKPRGFARWISSASS